jgi:hypothetical protein
MESMLGSRVVSGKPNLNTDSFTSDKIYAPFKNILYSKIKEHNSKMLTKRYMFEKEEEGTGNIRSRNNSMGICHGVNEHSKGGTKANASRKVSRSDKVRQWEPIHRGFRKYMIHSRAKYH